MDAKPPVQSKTLWINWVVVALGAALLILDAVTNGTLKLPAGIDADGAVVALIVGIANIVLRYLTAQPLAR